MDEDSMIFQEEEPAPVKLTGKTKVMIVVILLGLLILVLVFITITFSVYYVARYKLGASDGWWQIMRRILLSPNILYTLLIPVTIFGAVYRNLSGWYITMSVYYYAAITMLFAFIAGVYQHGTLKYIAYTSLLALFSILSIIFLNNPGVKIFFKIKGQGKQLQQNIVSVLFALGVLVVYVFLRVSHHWIKF